MKLLAYASLVQATACAGHLLRSRQHGSAELEHQSVFNQTGPSCLHSQALLAVANTPSQEAKVFEDVYQDGVWAHGGAPLSGAGSSVGATRVLCKTLLSAVVRIAKHKPPGSNINVLDAPSGDWTWMPTCLSQVENIVARLNLKLAYQGVDVADAAIALAEKRRGKVQSGLKHVSINQFQHVNLAQAGSLSRFGHFDVILSHDCIQHNPTANVRAILNNFNAAAELLVIDIDRANQNYRDIGLGDFRPVDITSPPYNFVAECTDPNTDQPAAGENEWFGILSLPLHH